MQLHVAYLFQGLWRLYTLDDLHNHIRLTYTQVHVCVCVAWGEVMVKYNVFSPDWMASGSFFMRWVSKEVGSASLEREREREREGRERESERERERGGRGRERKRLNTTLTYNMCLPDKSWEWHGYGSQFTIREENEHSVPHPSPFPPLCAVELSPSPSSLCRWQLLWLSVSTTSSLLGVRSGGDEGTMRSIEETTPFTDWEGSYSTTWLYWPKLREREREVQWFFFSNFRFYSSHTSSIPRLGA